MVIPQPSSQPLRTRIYVDGYNFYYGCLKSTPFKWLDLLALFETQVLPGIQAPPPWAGRPFELTPRPALKYFTAKILEQAAKATDSVSSQARYHTALRKVHGDRLERVDGTYAINHARARLVDPVNPKKWARDCEEAVYWKIEEKKTDVNLALHLYHDAAAGQVDHVVVVTNDTDLEPALRMLRSHTNVLIGLVIPACDENRPANAELVQLAHWTRGHVSEDELRGAQLPRVVLGNSRRPTIKPESWYARPDLVRAAKELALQVLKTEGRVFRWLETPNEYFDGNRPLDLLTSEEGAEQVMAYMQNYLSKEA